MSKIVVVGANHAGTACVNKILARLISSGVSVRQYSCKSEVFANGSRIT